MSKADDDREQERKDRVKAEQHEREQQERRDAERHKQQDQRGQEQKREQERQQDQGREQMQSNSERYQQEQKREQEYQQGGNQPKRDPDRQGFNYSPAQRDVDGTGLATQYNQDGTVKTPQQLAAEPNPEDLGPPGMPATSASDGPWSTETIPTGWSRFPTEEEVAYLNKKYPQSGGAPYQPGGEGVARDKTAKDATKDAGARPSDNTAERK